MRRAIGKDVRLERIENVVGVGTPDVLACCHITAFVELKAVDAPPVRETTRVLGDKGLSRDQRNWHVDWHQWGVCDPSDFVISVPPTGAMIFCLLRNGRC